MYLQTLDYELEQMLIEGGHQKDGWLAISTIREDGIVDVEFINSPEPHKHHAKLWTEENVYFCEHDGWKFIVSIWSDEPLKFGFKWDFVKKYQSRISALIRDLSAGMGAFRDVTDYEDCERLNDMREAFHAMQQEDAPCGKDY